MRHEVLVTAGAERDLEDLHGYIAEHDSLKHADDVLDKLMAVVEKLATCRAICSFHSTRSRLRLLLRAQDVDVVPRQEALPHLLHDEAGGCPRFADFSNAASRCASRAYSSGDIGAWREAPVTIPSPK
jgi:plasmid stabilization system protein ParE